MAKIFSKLVNLKKLPHMAALSFYLLLNFLCWFDFPLLFSFEQGRILDAFVGKFGTFKRTIPQVKMHNFDRKVLIFLFLLCRSSTLCKNIILLLCPKDITWFFSNFLIDNLKFENELFTKYKVSASLVMSLVTIKMDICAQNY